MSRFVFLMALGLAACRTSPVRGEPHLEIYKVQDIVRCHQTSSFSISCEIPDHPEGCGQFERKLRQATIGTPWDDETGWSLIFQNSLLIVRADESTQHLVRSFLAAERAKAPSDVK